MIGELDNDAHNDANNDARDVGIARPRTPTGPGWAAGGPRARMPADRHRQDTLARRPREASVSRPPLWAENRAAA